ncbi:single-stranded-DNA-specific exonuclease RecJ [Fusobacterium necrophorum]|uniref:Single-stranded-DNA-specific exonuclease RecJ n=1 Tax=Fusobacterium necrophorum subsp. funduliforme TaxID=143387 RepID=A0A170MUR4_9FUSO|nr:single-stranded-DNA-specific exonuclease RecJ [Fusobacterium necrophorum]AYV93455.1 single-stranded-DNA-specific exonuclease RecJ [Fusobacterium necrophorum subsp. funduliforme]EIJ67077.1 single-stranded-DNA-specific exonuclease RecJ [Fusobacterium necrophorum subsp. funduliforme ATCC 51357]EYD69809.1 putative exonuclease, RecJ [Fusobacterium necrophorum subsp. funduliforme B35]KAB0552793.1 single-stranded-DNA-specific exonuclease RecJ [Fusobacterium necrophorum subsp. funduliforme]KYL03034
MKGYNSEKLLTTLLKNRGIQDFSKLHEFINPSVSSFRNPFLFENMETVVSMLERAKQNRTRICIYGDYDVDGITGTAFLVKVFRQIGMDVVYYIPSREEEGYGLTKKNIDFLYEKRVRLVITVDTGYNSLEDIAYARAKGMEVIISDHHKTVREAGDEDILFLNPKLSQSYEFKFLSGAGVALKIAQAFYQKLSLDLDGLYQYLDIVMIGTIADVVPMVDENRIIIKNGLKVLQKTKVKGLAYLLKYLKFGDKNINTTDVSYYISPLINSLGRVGTSRMAADFFIKEDDFEIYNIIEEMKKLNKRRRELEKNIYDDAIRAIEKAGKKRLSCIFLSSRRWHPGVIGVVSSRLSLKFQVPVVLIALEGKLGKASCRSIKNVSIYNVLEEVKEELVRYGGHDLAAGFTIEEEKIEKVKRYFMESFSKKTRNVEEKKKYNIDMELPLEVVGESLLQDIEKISPFGSENPHPLFLEKNLSFREIRKFGVDQRHFNGILVKEGKEYPAVGFDLGHRIHLDTYLAQSFDIVYYPEKVNLHGEKMIQIRIKDIIIKDEFYDIFIKS